MTDTTDITAPEPLPDEHVGKLEPDHRCRAWIAHLEQYCDADAGEDTYHEGTGRCAKHDGRPPARAGAGKYDQLPARLRERYDRQLQHGDEALGILDDLALARATLEDYVSQYDDMIRAIQLFLEWWDDDGPGSGEDGSPPPRFNVPDLAAVHRQIKDIVSMAHHERKLRADTHISRAEHHRRMAEMAEVVKRYTLEEGLTPEDRLRKIRDGWMGLD